MTEPRDPINENSTLLEAVDGAASDAVVSPRTAVIFRPEKTPTPTFPYRIHEPIGRGAMGIVYRATDVTLERTVAIKILRPSVLEEAPRPEQEQMRRRFLQEARAAAALSHPGVTTVYQVGEEQGVPYLVMEWLQGTTLDDILRQHGRFSVPEAIRLTVALLETLDEAHRHGVVHRDIKPSNLMLLHDGRLKVTDFGIARLRGREVVKTQAGTVLGTPRFASPEQLRGQDVDGRSDLFAVGILLYSLLTGRFPFDGESFAAVATAIFESHPVPPSQLVPSVPSPVEEVILKALSKERAARYSTAAAMAEPLHPWLQGDPAVSSSPVPGSGAVAFAAAAHQRESMIIHRDLPRQPGQAMIQLFRSWSSRTLPRQSTAMLLDRLLEKPLHAAAFAGAVMINNTCVLLHNGLLLAAIDLMTGDSGDAVAELLPEDCDCDPLLFPVPDTLPRGLIPLLATVLGPPRYRHRDLDSSFVNLPALAAKLREEKFDGLIRLTRGEAFGLVFFDRGQEVLNLFSVGWEDVPIDQSWSQWMPQHRVQASVEELNEQPLSEAYRRLLRDFTVVVEPLGLQNSPGKTRGELPGTTTQGLLTVASRGFGEIDVRPVSGRQDATEGYERAPLYRFLVWAVRHLPQYFAERQKITAWKYLVDWLLLVRQARLYHTLERPQARDSDFFDLVTFDESGKVLHLGHRLARPTAENVRLLVDRMIAAKTARSQNGDIGGAFLIAPSFDEEALAAYTDAMETSSSGRWFKMEESFTGYEGFIRVGPRRGFHLLLIEEKGDDFLPLLVA